MNLGLKDKVVLITGTNNPEGIGAATALAMRDIQTSQGGLM